MKLSNNSPRAVKFEEIQSTVKKLSQDEGYEGFLGAMVCTKGILVLLFSPRFNKDLSLIVPGTDSNRVMSEVFEGLAHD